MQEVVDYLETLGFMLENLAFIKSEQFLVIVVGVEVLSVSGIYSQAGYMDILYTSLLANALESLFGKTVLSTDGVFF